MMRLSLYATAASVALVLAAGPAFAIKPASNNSPGNSGINLEQTRLSNAGAGNGGEFVQDGDPVTVVTTRTETTENTSDPYTDVTGSGDLPTVVDTGPWVVTSVQTLPSGNIRYRLQREVETTTGTYIEETTYVDKTVTADTYSDSTTTTNYVDVDPGKSGDHNNAPEVDGDQDVVVVSVLTGSETSDPVPEQVGDPVVTEDTDTSTSSQNATVVDNNPHVGDTYDVGDEFPDSEVPGGGA